MINNGPVDPGLQNERTRLAWQRTTLTGLGCALITARLGFGSMPVLAVTVAATATIVSIMINVLARRRYLITATTWHDGRLGTDGRTPVGLAMLTLLTAVVGLGYVIFGHSRP